MLKKILKNSLFLLLCLFFANPIISQSKKVDLQNSNLEGVNQDGDFYWWKHQAINGAKATFSVENVDVNTGSKKALKAEIHSLAEKPWFTSTSFNQKFNGKTGDEITIQFYAKKSGNGKGKIKLVFQNDEKGSFQGKDFFLSEEWQPYTHTFTIKQKNNNNQLKFWYLESGTTYLIDDISFEKENY